ncbi:NlpC/P60 family protein [Amycolatopsis sp. NPDC004169]|uniref:C40 family peptidase n=1 Tax=Amycolatopsis sp. NPDC004169 TaxID=3154453 RepID=UPI0033A38DDD
MPDNVVPLECRVALPRTAQTQLDAGPQLPSGMPLRPGDLVFFGSSRRTITHVGIAISGTHMINVPYRGVVIRVDSVGPQFRCDQTGVRIGDVRPDQAPAGWHLGSV